MDVPKSIESTTHYGITFEETTVNTWKVAAASHGQRGQQQRPQAGKPLQRQTETCGHAGQRRWKTESIKRLKQRWKTECSPVRTLSPQHFGAFDSTASLYSGFGDGTCTSPSHPALSQTVDGTLNETLNISDVPCPAVVDSSASCQSKVS